MPFLHEQVKLINENIKSSLNDARFAGAYYGGIAKDVTRKTEGKTEVFPGAIGVDGKESNYSINDDFPLILYHKPQTNNYVNATRQFGGEGSERISRIQMKMVVSSFQSKIRLTAEQLEALIAVNFPTMLKTQTDLKVRTILSFDSSDLNQRRVFGEEYQGIEYFLGVEHILFAMRYTIETNFRQGCIDICDCT